jgi:hypothetical protein
MYSSVGKLLQQFLCAFNMKVVWDFQIAFQVGLCRQSSGIVMVCP